MFRGCVSLDGTQGSQVHVYNDSEGYWGLVALNSIYAFNADHDGGLNPDLLAEDHHALYIERRQLRWCVTRMHGASYWTHFAVYSHLPPVVFQAGSPRDCPQPETARQSEPHHTWHVPPIAWTQG